MTALEGCSLDSSEEAYLDALTPKDTKPRLGELRRAWALKIAMMLSPFDNLIKAAEDIERYLKDGPRLGKVSTLRGHNLPDTPESV